MLLNQPEICQFIFLREIFHKKSKTIHLYCFSQYQKYLKLSHGGHMNLNAKLTFIFTRILDSLSYIPNIFSRLWGRNFIRIFYFKKKSNKNNSSKSNMQIFMLSILVPYTHSSKLSTKQLYPLLFNKINWEISSRLK